MESEIGKEKKGERLKRKKQNRKKREEKVVKKYQQVFVLAFIVK